MISLGGGGHIGGPGHLVESLGRESEGRAFDPRVVRRLLEYVRPYGARLGASFVLMILSSALSLAAPYLMKIAIDRDITGGDLAGLTRTSLALVAVLVGTYLTGSFERYALSWIGQRLLADLRSALFRKIQHLPLSYHDRHKSGVTISRVINDVGVINDLFTQGLVTVVGDVLLLAGIVAVMISMSPKLALLAFCVVPFMVLATAVFSRHARTAFRRTRTRIAAVVGDLAENLGGMRVIQAFGQEGHRQHGFDRVNRENREAHVAAMSLSFVFMPVVELLGVAATAVVLWFGGRAVAAEELTLGVVVAFLTYVSRFFQPIQELSQLYTTLQSAMAGGERVIEVLDESLSVRDPTPPREMPPVRGAIELDAVTFSYVPGVPVIRGLSLSVAAGDTVALVGPTGAGKSSIANLIARFYDVDTGRVVIDGVDVRSVTQRSLRSQMGVVTQEPILFTGTIRENIAFGRPAGPPDALVEAARDAEADPFIRRMPEGYDTRILEGGVNLSVGQRQLICIARALYADPRILILDEATSSVDSVTELLIQRALARVLRGRTAVVIAHRLSTIRTATRIHVIENGTIAESGTHDELIRRGGRYAVLCRNLYGSA